MTRNLADIVATPPARPGPQMIRVELIDVPTNRLRPANPDWVALYADDVKAGKAFPPIEIRPRSDKPGRFWLVVGLHRLEAQRLAGSTAILSDVEEMSEAEARLREIDENLHRAELSALDRAIFLAERKRVWEELHPETKHGGKRRGRDQVANLATRFTTEAADRVGLSERAIRRAVALADALSPEAIEIIRGTYLADHGSDLQALARLREDEQLRAVKAIASGQAKTLKDSLQALGRGPAPVDEQERLFQAVISAWSRMNAKTRRRVMDHLTRNGGKGNGEAARQEPKKSRA